MAGTAATRPRPPRAPAPRRPRLRPGALLLLGLALALALAGGAAGQEPPTEEVEVLYSEASARCRVEFNATGFPEAVVFRAPEKTEVFTDRPARLAATARARAFAADFAADFAGDPPNVAVTGWRKRRKGGWRRAYAVVTATAVTFDAATRELRYAVVQFPGQAGATKGFRGGGDGGARREALRFCAGFVDGALTTVQQLVPPPRVRSIRPPSAATGRNAPRIILHYQARSPFVCGAVTWAGSPSGVAPHDHIQDRTP